MVFRIVCWSITCLANTAMSSLKESDEHTSPPATPGSLGVHVASSHFSKTSAKRGNNGCLKEMAIVFGKCAHDTNEQKKSNKILDINDDDSTIFYKVITFTALIATLLLHCACGVE